jgi:ubiquinone/menaquinone biosynthesis C-methylase UbiE
MSSPLERIRYAATQGARVAWYMGHYYAAQPFYRAAKAGDERPAKPTRPTPGRDRMLADLAELFRRDLANVERGLYPHPDDAAANPLRLLRRSRKFFADLPEAARRRREGDAQEVSAQATHGALPDYFLQNFHFQSGGYLTEESAELYDMQVEVLFSGAANAMRRQALVPLAHAIRGRRQQDLSLLDVACGTGRFLGQVKTAFPLLPVTGIDLSHAYALEARRHLERRRGAGILIANAERLPFADASQDLVACVYLFHELPPKVRRIVAREIARVLKPGGRFVLVDTLQYGDRPDYDGLLEMFPVRFHEPFYASYVEEDLEALFGKHGLEPQGDDLAFLSKVSTFDKRA